MKFLLLETVDSTNSYVATHAAELENFTMVAANTQTAGRGQRGNSWESEPGKNLTFTLFYRPEGIAPREQFAISEAVALAVARFLEDEGVAASVKWPNDIYHNDYKISGILIEHSLCGDRIEHTRIGVGLNVNQTTFRSDAPNPISMAQVIGKESPISRVAALLGTRLEHALLRIQTPEGRETIHKEFKEKLWRGDSRPYPFRRKSDSLLFSGIITDVDPTGPISIINSDSGETLTFHFKEVEFILKD